MGSAHRGLAIIRDHAQGHPAECCTGPDMRTDPGGQTLRPGGLGISVVRGPLDGDANRRFADFPSEGIDYRYRLASVVDKECLACPVALPYDQIELSSPLARRVTHLTALEATGGTGLVFLL